ncbi:MAG: proline dehydrogenase family protein [Gaiellaceae bacterium]
MALLDRAIVRLLPAVPKPVVQKLSERYIAGPKLADATLVVERMNAHGKLATIDVLGEEITHETEARAIAATYDEVFDTIESEGLGSNVSVKPTALGLKLDHALCRENLEDVVRHAAESGNFVRIDMEDSSTTDGTLRLYRELRAAGVDNVGIVLQSALRRTARDIEELADLVPNVRLVKGIYLEPAEIAFQSSDEIRASFVHALEALLARGCYTAIATHDNWLLEEGRRLVGEHGRSREEYEFQMLLGVREELADGLVRDGERVRIYVPFGEHWYAYSLRRLQENPKIAGYIAADTFNRLLPRRNGSG